jgi:hypothetical protein
MRGPALFAPANGPVFLPVSSEKGPFSLNFGPVSALDRQVELITYLLSTDEFRERFYDADGGNRTLGGCFSSTCR